MITLPALGLLKESGQLSLDTFVDVKQLPVAHELRKHGVIPENIRVVWMGEEHYTMISFIKRNTIYVGGEIESWNFDAEDIYVILSHELGHFLQPLLPDVDRPPRMKKGQRIYETSSGGTTVVHARSKREQEAIYWEGIQAAKFGWGRDEYARHVQKVYPAGSARWQIVERTERPYAVLPVLSRRPVPVRKYARRVKR